MTDPKPRKLKVGDMVSIVQDGRHFGTGEVTMTISQLGKPDIARVLTDQLILESIPVTYLVLI